MTDTGDGQDDELRAALTRVIRRLASEEPADQRGTAMLPVLDAHFGQPADELPVVQETVESHRSVDVDIALEQIVAEDPTSRLVGIGGGDQRHHSSLSDLMAQAGWGRFR